MTDTIKISRELRPLIDRVCELEQQHGGIRAAAKAIGIDPGYLSRLKDGYKTNPSDEVLSLLGLERSVLYRAKGTHGDRWRVSLPRTVAAQSAPAGEHEAVARAICEACEESPDHKGDAQGNEYRWQDYLPVADAAISAWQRTQADWMPEARVTGAWESARIGDFNAGWNACRDSAFTLMKKAAYMELDTTKRSIAIQDELRAMLSSAPAQPASPAQPEVQRLREALERDTGYRDGLAAGWNFGVADDIPGYQRSLSRYNDQIREARAALAASTGQEVGK